MECRGAAADTRNRPCEARLSRPIHNRVRKIDALCSSSECFHPLLLLSVTLIISSIRHHIVSGWGSLSDCPVPKSRTSASLISISGRAPSECVPHVGGATTTNNTGSNTNACSTPSAMIRANSHKKTRPAAKHDNSTSHATTTNQAQYSEHLRISQNIVAPQQLTLQESVGRLVAHLFEMAPKSAAAFQVLW